MTEETPYDIAYLAAELKRRREAKGLSMRGLSDLAKLSGGHVEQIEKQRVKRVELRTIGALAAALGCDVTELARETGSPRTAARIVELDDPEPNRPAAIALLEGIVDEETRRALPLVSNKSDQPLTLEDWYQKGLELDELRKRPRAPKQPDPIPPGPPVSRAQLLERREKLKPRRR